MPVGLPARSAIVSDTLGLRGIEIGGFAGFSWGEVFPIYIGIGAGGLFGQLSDARSGTFVSTDGQRHTLRPASVASSVSFFWIRPELRISRKLTRSFAVSAGIGATFLVSLSNPSWDASQQIDLSTDGIGTYPKETLSGSLLVTIGPQIGATYLF
jgi:hypothetical protein